MTFSWRGQAAQRTLDKGGGDGMCVSVRATNTSSKFSLSEKLLFLKKSHYEAQILIFRCV